LQPGQFLSALLLLTGLAAPPAVAAGPINLLILGDSLTAGYGLPSSAGFQAKLAAALHEKGADVALIDGAVSGDTSSDAAARLDWVLAGGPVDAAIVELGANDGLRGLDPAIMQKNLGYILDVLTGAAFRHDRATQLWRRLWQPFPRRVRHLEPASGDHLRPVFPGRLAGASRSRPGRRAASECQRG
jgi:lysophospholipase L1-like esterase